MQNSKIKKFSDMIVWQKGHILVIEIYRITKKFPNDERFGLTNQLRRASVSFTSNLAEGFGRFTNNDKAHFYSMALGSLFEIENQLIISKDLDYLSKEECQNLLFKSLELNKMCTVLIKKIKNYTKY